MAYAVVIYFDKISSQTIVNTWKELVKNNISQNMLSTGIQPHFTLAIYDSFDCVECEKEIMKIAENSGLIDIQADYFGIFPNTSSVIFIAPAPGQALIQFHHNIHNSLKNHVGGSWEIYQPGKWVPHLTIARDINNHHLSSALEICMKIPLPLKMRITQMGVVSFEPIKPLFTMDIGSQP